MTRSKSGVSRREWAAVATEEGLDIWNLRRGEIEKSIPEINIYKQGFAFSEDGSLLVIVSKKMGICLWQTDDWSRKQLIQDTEFEDPLNLCFSFSRDNRYLAVTGCPSAKSHVNNVLIDLVSGKVEMLLDTQEEKTMARTFSPDGTYFAVGVNNNRIHLWNIRKRKKLPHPFDGHVAGVRGLSFSPNSRTLVSCGDNQVKLWNVETGEEFFTLHQAQGETAWPLFSPDGTFLVTATAEPSLHLWKAPSWEEIASAESSTPNPN